MPAPGPAAHLTLNHGLEAMLNSFASSQGRAGLHQAADDEGTRHASKRPCLGLSGVVQSQVDMIQQLTSNLLEIIRYDGPVSLENLKHEAS